MTEKKIQFPFLITQDCGAGETEKIYTIDEKSIEIGLNSVGSIIPAKVSDNNIEKFDFVALEENRSESFKIKIPMPKFGVLRFSIQIKTEYKNNEYSLLTPVFYIGNNSDAQKYYEDNVKKYGIE